MNTSIAERPANLIFDTEPKFNQQIKLKFCKKSLKYFIAVKEGVNKFSLKYVYWHQLMCLNFTINRM